MPSEPTADNDPLRLHARIAALEHQRDHARGWAAWWSTPPNFAREASPPALASDGWDGTLGRLASLIDHAAPGEKHAPTYADLERQLAEATSAAIRAGIWKAE